MNFEALLDKSYSLWSEKADCERSICCWREVIQSGEGVSKVTLYKSFGIKPYITGLPAGAVWGGFELNGHCFFIINDTLYDFVGTALNASYAGLTPSTSTPYLAASQNTLMICWGGKLYRVNSGVLSTIALTFTPIDVAFLKNLFVVLSDSMSQFYWSEDDGATFPADLVQTAEADANNLQRIIVLKQQQQLWVIGNRITQIFYVGSNPNAPFVPNSSAGIGSGTNAPASVRILDNSIIMLEQDTEGVGTVVRSNGYNFEPISDFYVANIINGIADISDAIGMVFQIRDHNFYRLSFPTGDKTLDYHANMNEWHENPWFNWLEGFYHRHRANCIVAAFGKILVGDRDNGIIYEMGADIFTDYGFPIHWNRRTPHIIEENKREQIDRIELGMETGVGLAAPLWLNSYSLDEATFIANLATAVAGGSVTAAQALVLQSIYDFQPYIPLDPYPTPQTMNDLGFFPWGAPSALDDGTIIGTPPQMVMRYSRDGGKSFSNEQNRSMGMSGEKGKRVYWNRCGDAEDFVFDFFTTEPVKVAITQGILEAKALEF